MERVPCSYCGLPFKVRRVQPGESVYCCAGCALADRVRPADGQAGEFPVSRELILALVTGFGAFNQVLFAVLAWLMVGDGQLETAGRMQAISLGLGVVMWVLIAWTQWRTGTRGAVEVTVWIATLLLVAVSLVARAPGCAVLATGGQLVWQNRGWFRPRRRNQVNRLRRE